MFYLSIIPSLAMSALMIIYLLCVRKHDRILFTLCQIRRDIIFLIDKSSLEFDGTGYYSVRNLLYYLEMMIEKYEGGKVLYFNVRRRAAFLNECKLIAREAEKIATTDDVAIGDLSKRFKSTAACIIPLIPFGA